MNRYIARDDSRLFFSAGIKSLEQPLQTDSGRPRHSGWVAATTDTGPSRLTATFGRCPLISRHPIDAVPVLAANDRSCMARRARIDPEVTSAALISPASKLPVVDPLAQRDATGTRQQAQAELGTPGVMGSRRHRGVNRRAGSALDTVLQRRLRPGAAAGRLGLTAASTSRHRHRLPAVATTRPIVVGPGMLALARHAQCWGRSRSRQG